MEASENGLANLCLALLLIQRWVVFGHFPLSNLYESLIFLSWSMTSIILFLEKMNDNFLIGALLSPIALFINAFATLSLPAEMQKANLLVPALQSNWLMMHVTIMMLSYAALIFRLFIIYNIFSYYFNKNKSISYF